MASHSVNSLYKFLTWSLNPGQSDNCKSFSSLLRISSVIPDLISTGYNLTASGFLFATYSIYTPPSIEATIAGPWEFLSRIKAK